MNDFLWGFVAGLSAFYIISTSITMIQNKRKLREQQDREQYRQKLKNFEREVNSLPHYKFAVNKDEGGWRWEVLHLYVMRGLSYRYDPVNGAYGYENTKEAAIAAGRARCEQLTNIKKWKEQREVYSL